MRQRILGAWVAAVLFLCAAGPRIDTRATRARMLDRWALEIVNRADATVEERQRGLRALDEAIALEPHQPTHWFLLGRLREQGLQDGSARTAYQRSIALASDDPEPRLWLALSWKRTWVRTLDRGALDRAIAHLDTVTKLRPFGSEGWLQLAPLLYEQNQLAKAALAAERALTGRPTQVNAALAAAYLAFRTGDLERSNSLFRATIPRLDPRLRAQFDDPLRLFRPGAKPAAVAESLQHESTSPSLAELDPDPTSAVNELQLECWSRMAHAQLLFFDARYPELDARAENYVRYGPPASVELNPIGTRLTFVANPLGRARDVARGELPMDEIPLNAMRLDYPELGMKVLLHDRSLLGRFQPPANRDFLPGSVPDARRLASRSDLLSFGQGFAVLPTLPPTAQRLDVQGSVSAFESATEPRLLVQARVPGSPADTLFARWVARDERGREVARGEQVPSVSACDPGRIRLAEFATGLPAGRYDVAISVRDAHRRRGVYRGRVVLAPVRTEISLSDLVLCCGDPAPFSGTREVRFEADVDATITGGRSVVVYMEIYRLARAADGIRRLRYEYEVRRLTVRKDGSIDRDPERAPSVTRWASREESQVEETRRQFIRVQAASLPAGHYQIRVRVHDMTSGAEASRTLEFVKV